MKAFPTLSISRPKIPFPPLSNTGYKIREKKRLFQVNLQDFSCLDFLTIKPFSNRQAAVGFLL